MQGNSIFFAVKRIEDPIGLLPAKLILGINKVMSICLCTDTAPQPACKMSRNPPSSIELHGHHRTVSATSMLITTLAAYTKPDGVCHG